MVIWTYGPLTSDLGRSVGGKLGKNGIVRTFEKPVAGACSASMYGARVEAQ
jgi:hypothetical protein